MLKAKQLGKKPKPLSKTMLSSVSLKKGNLCGQSTNRPKFVQKILTQQNEPRSNKKAFFNRTQQMKVANRSFERVGLESQRYSELRSRTPSPMRRGMPESNEKLVQKMLSVQRKRKEQGLVEHLIHNILGQENSPQQKPREILKRINQQNVQLRLKNIRLEKQMKRMKDEKALLPREVLEQLILDVFELVVVSKSIENIENMDVVLGLLKEKSKSLMLGLSPLASMFDLESQMKQRGTQLKLYIDNSVKSPKYPISSLMRLIPVENTNKHARISDASTVSRTVKNSLGLPDSLQTSGLIIEEALSGNESSDNDQISLSNNDSSLTGVCHRSGSEPDVERTMGVATCDFSGSNINDLSLKKGDKVQILKRTSSQWWIGMRDNVVGYFPAEKVRISQ